MLTCLIRTVIIYLLLVLALRTTGKRQIGELEISELVSTFLISEIAAAPIGNQEIPLSFAVLPILTIISLEVIVSFLTTRSAFMKKIFLGSPIVLIRRGHLQQKALAHARMSVEELLGELRQNGVVDIDDAAYAILENNGKLSVSEHGIAHALVIDGAIKKEALEGAGRDEAWLYTAVRKSGYALQDIFLFTVDDDGKINLIPKES